MAAYPNRFQLSSSKPCEKCGDPIGFTQNKSGKWLCVDAEYDKISRRWYGKRIGFNNNFIVTHKREACDNIVRLKAEAKRQADFIASGKTPRHVLVAQAERLVSRLVRLMIDELDKANAAKSDDLTGVHRYGKLAGKAQLRVVRRQALKF